MIGYFTGLKAAAGGGIFSHGTFSEIVKDQGLKLNLKL